MWQRPRQRYPQNFEEFASATDYDFNDQADLATAHAGESAKRIPDIDWIAKTNQ